MTNDAPSLPHVCLGLEDRTRRVLSAFLQAEGLETRRGFLVRQLPPRPRHRPLFLGIIMSITQNKGKNNNETHRQHTRPDAP